MEGWAYPYSVKMLQFELEGRTLRMAYMDVQPVNPNGKTVVLFHGKNFAGDYWSNTLRELSAQGYRVIAPDQIGFGKSSKPEMRYTFAMLADNTTRLLDYLNVGRVAIVANSMGGMLGVHFSRRNPDRVAALVLENPLGLEDYVLSIPPHETFTLAKLEMAQTPASYRKLLGHLVTFPCWAKPPEGLSQVQSWWSSTVSVMCLTLKYLNSFMRQYWSFRLISPERRHSYGPHSWLHRVLCLWPPSHSGL